jgi:hypothetical protein
MIVLAALASNSELSAINRLKMSIVGLFHGAGVSPFDLLWAFLAVSTAFKLGSGGSDS